MGRGDSCLASNVCPQLKFLFDIDIFIATSSRAPKRNLLRSRQARILVGMRTLLFVRSAQLVVLRHNPLLRAHLSRSVLHLLSAFLARSNHSRGFQLIM
jgi:hypothetical protein